MFRIAYFSASALGGVAVGLLLGTLLEATPPLEQSERKVPARPLAARAETHGERVAAAARAVVDRGTEYRATYEALDYPGGDVPLTYGVCTDLVVRAYRGAGIDLQRLLYEDRAANPEAYPTHIWEHKEADANIDHRRCQNLDVFFSRQANSLPTEWRDVSAENAWQPGDVVFLIDEGAAHPWHVGIVIEATLPGERPVLAHLYPPQAAAEPLWKDWNVHSRYRWPTASAE